MEEDGYYSGILGMLYKQIKYSYSSFSLSWKTRFIAFVVLVVLIALWEYYFVICDYNNIWKDLHGSIFGSTQIGMTWWNTLHLILIILLLDAFADGIKHINCSAFDCIARLIRHIGDNSLYIFLYHMLFLVIYQKLFSNNGVYQKMICLIMIIGGPIALYYIVLQLKRILAELLNYATKGP